MMTEEPCDARRDLEHAAGERHELRRLGIASIAVIGSTVRNGATRESDVDLLVEFSKPVGLFEFNRIRRRLEELVGHTVDLVTRDALQPALAETIRAQAISAET
jgi:predicted nucleotidyltransferase